MSSNWVLHLKTLSKKNFNLFWKLNIFITSMHTYSYDLSFFFFFLLEAQMCHKSVSKLFSIFILQILVIVTFFFVLYVSV